MSHAPAPHPWLQSRLIFSVTSVSALAIALLACWHSTGIPWDGPRLHLNLALAWVPYLCSLGLVWLEQEAPQHKAAWWLLFAVWLAFFPNAPYLVTDLLYLPQFQEKLWYSIGMFLTFSMAGLLLSMVSLYLVHSMLRVRLPAGLPGAIVLLVLLLSGLGVFLGRFVRLNSWDLLTNPRDVLADLMTKLNDPSYHADPFYFSLGFALLLGVCYGVFVSVRNAPRSREEIWAWGREKS
jgi:uncharacterized membrane protein